MSTIAIGMKTSKFMHWAISCSTFIKRVMRGIKKVPPPIPIPAKTPDKIAMSKNHKKFILHRIQNHDDTSRNHDQRKNQSDDVVFQF